MVAVQKGAEITGIYEQGADLFFNTQHPDDDLGNEFARAIVGVVSNVTWDANELAVPTSDADKKVATTTLGTRKSCCNQVITA